MDQSYEWKLWYADGKKTFSNEDGAPNDSPHWGVIFILQPNSDKDVIFNHTYMIYREDLGRWSGHDLIGYIDQQVHYGPLISCTRIGRDILTDDFSKLLNRELVKMRGK